MDAGTREERLQMRQRGAGTRRVKDVNFGFSFGGPSLGLPEAPAPTNLPEPEQPPQSQTEPNTSTPRASQPESLVPTNVQRTPGSARNKIPARPSPYDFPPDDEPAQPRSNKRRKINPPDIQAGTPRRSQAPKPKSAEPPTTQNPSPVEADAPEAQQPEASVQDTTLLDNEPPEPVQAEPIAAEVPAAEEVPETTESRPPPIAEPTFEQSTHEPSPKAAPISIPNHPPPTKKGLPKATSTEEEHIAHSADASSKSRRKAQTKPQVEQSTGSLKEQKSSGRHRESASPVSKRGRKPTKKDSKDPAHRSTESPAEPAPEKAQETQPEQQAKPGDAQSKSQPGGKRTRGRPSLPGKKKNSPEQDIPSRSPVDATRAAGEQPTAAPAAASRRGKKQTKKAAPPVPEPSRSAEREVQEQEPTPEAEAEPEPVAEALNEVSKSRRKKPEKKKKGTKGAESAQKRQTESEAQPEPEPEPEPETSKSRGTKKTKRRVDPESPNEEEEPEAEATRATNKEKSKEISRKPREPRGETVPVTVHRLANVSALGSMYTTRGSGDEEEEDSADELSTRHKTKLPNRGGVNPADVLSQICRETLEKTLTTLKDGIANETNQTRRAEWSRKRKAVESFGLELDGRLLDLSEMLDSNFVLGMQLKKAKRDMMDMRSHLYKVRRERESIALQLDAVRGKHMEEENTKTTRSAINNSLHSLDLALDRSQNRASTSDTSGVDLEFMLRTVADEVSSQAPGGQGGLLDQIRAFNAQLEATARHLEG